MARPGPQQKRAASLFLESLKLILSTADVREVRDTDAALVVDRAVVFGDSDNLCAMLFKKAGRVRTDIAEALDDDDACRRSLP